MNNFRQVDRQTGFLLPPSVDEWLAERHLARFVMEVIEQLDLSRMVKAYRGSGSACYHPSLLLGLLVCGHATAVLSSRKIERLFVEVLALAREAGMLKLGTGGAGRHQGRGPCQPA